MQNDDTQDFDLDLELEDETTTEQPDKDWMAEALKYKSMAKRYKAKAETVKPEAPKPEDAPITNNANTAPVANINDEVVDLRLDGYSKDEVTFIMSNGGRKAIEDPNSYVAIAINSKREQRKAEDAKDEVSHGANQSDPILRKYTTEQLNSMSSAELAKILPKA